MSQKPWKHIDERVKLCNCARCRCALLGESMHGVSHLGDYEGLPYVFERIHGRPYCQECYGEKQRENLD